MSASFSPIHGSLITLQGGGYTATISEVGANLNRLTAPDGRDLILSVAPANLRAGMRGSVLAPWPNRIDSGTYSFAAQNQQLPLTEPELSNASHGLAAWVPWRLGIPEPVDGGQQITCVLHLYPSPGYPHTLDLILTYMLTDEGLGVELAAHNVGETSAPYAAGFHPYLVAGNAPVDTEGAADGWMLTFPATSYMQTNNRMIPIAEHPVAGSGLDFTSARWLAGTDINHGFRLAHLEQDTQVELRDAQGRGAVLTCGEGMGWVQVYTDGVLRRGVAVEPMTAPANAFSTGESLTVLKPGESHRCRWGLAALG